MRKWLLAPGFRYPVRAGMAAGMEGGECDAVRRATSTGEPLGGREFVTAMEQEAGRRLRVLARGRPTDLPFIWRQNVAVID